MPAKKAVAKVLIPPDCEAVSAVSAFLCKIKMLWGIIQFHRAGRLPAPARCTASSNRLKIRWPVEMSTQSCSAAHLSEPFAVRSFGSLSRPQAECCLETRWTKNLQSHDVP